MTNLEKLQEAANENKELSDALNMISGPSKEEVIQKILETAHRFGFDLEEDDVIVEQALDLDDLDQVAGGVTDWSIATGMRESWKKKPAFPRVFPSED